MQLYIAQTSNKLMIDKTTCAHDTLLLIFPISHHRDLQILLIITPALGLLAFYFFHAVADLFFEGFHHHFIV